eukprot:592981-Pelagomonas_calceolata.AAC.9
MGSDNSEDLYRDMPVTEHMESARKASKDRQVRVCMSVYVCMHVPENVSLFDAKCMCAHTSQSACKAKGINRCVCVRACATVLQPAFSIGCKLPRNTYDAHTVTVPGSHTYDLLSQMCAGSTSLNPRPETACNSAWDAKTTLHGSKCRRCCLLGGQIAQAHDAGPLLKMERRRRRRWRNLREQEPRELHPVSCPSTVEASSR